MRKRPPIVLQCNSLSVQFEWTGDRYRHDILSGKDIVASSIEGDSLDEVPPSPPLQDLSLESLGGDVLAVMGVGGAGRGHWSISVTRVDNDGLLFELACRGDVAKLGSQYRILGDITIEPLPTGQLQSPAKINSTAQVRPIERLVGTSVWSYIVRRTTP